MTEQDAQRVLAVAGDDEALIELIQEDVEERWDEDWLAETDKAWDAIHRCLTRGLLKPGPTTPRSMCILGGKQLHRGESHVVSFLPPKLVTMVAASIGDLDEAWMRMRYFRIPQSDYEHPLSEEDFGYTWEYFQGVQALFQKAAEARRAMMFTVSL